MIITTTMCDLRPHANVFVKTWVHVHVNNKRATLSFTLTLMMEAHLSLALSHAKKNKNTGTTHQISDLSCDNLSKNLL